MLGGRRTDEGANPAQGVCGEPVPPHMVEALDGGDQTYASFLKELGVWKSATRCKLSTDHPDKT
jgi:hypothetical protein